MLDLLRPIYEKTAAYGHFELRDTLDARVVAEQGPSGRCWWPPSDR